MAFNGTEGGTITRSKAQTLTQNYRNSNTLPTMNNVRAILYGKNHINAILAQPGCMGIRIYMGKEGTANSDTPRFILAGYDANGDNIMGQIVDMGVPCPSACATNPF